MYNLFLDDFRHPYDCVAYMRDPMKYAKWNWVVVKNHEEFVKKIEEDGLPEFISFDHDLADEHYDNTMYQGVEEYSKKYEHFKEKTGLDCAKWLTEHCMDTKQKLPDFEIHSMNPAGGENIRSLLLNFKKFQDQENQ
jgi:hypothetical protein